MRQKLFAARFESALARAKMSQAELSRSSGIPTSTISSWFGQKPSSPSVDALEAVCRVLDVSLDWMVGRTEDPRVIPYGELLLDMNSVERIRQAQHLDDISDLLAALPSVVVGFDVTPNTAMPDRTSAQRILDEMVVRVRKLEWKRGERK